MRRQKPGTEDLFYSDEGAYVKVIAYSLRPNDIGIVVFEGIETPTVYAFKTTKKKVLYMMDRYPVGEQAMLRDSDGELAEVSLSSETLGLPIPPGTNMEVTSWILKDREEAREELPRGIFGPPARAM